MSQEVNTQNSNSKSSEAGGISDIRKNSIEKFCRTTAKVRFILGLVSLIVGLLAANLALFHWVERAGLYYLLGEYARYVCAYGGFLAMILGAMLINDFIVQRNVLKKRRKLSAASLAMNPEKGSLHKRIACNRVGIFRKLIIPLFLVTLLSTSLPIAFPFVSYTAAVTIIVKSTPVYYLHRTDLSGVTPAGKLMDTIQPPSNQSEILYNLLRGETVYFYSPMLSESYISSGTWFLYLWASTVSEGKVSRLTVQIHVVSSDGSVEKTLVGSITDIVIGYGYSEKIISITGNHANISSTDRIRLTLHAQTGAENDPKGLSFYYDGYGTYQTIGHETRLEPP